jgi:hypothetical protein
VVKLRIQLMAPVTDFSIGAQLQLIIGGEANRFPLPTVGGHS